MAKIEIPDLKGKELFKFLVENRAAIEAQKKMELKRADAVYYAAPRSEYLTGKAIAADATELTVTSVINTTYWYDSHGDVHIDGLWKKSLAENRQLLLLQEHSLSFKGIISDEVKGYVKKMTWRSLGVDADGSTEALIFESKVRDKRNPYMFEQYRDGHVKNHSVGMRYVKLKMAINSEEEYYESYKATWDQYIDKIANKDEVEEKGYFWAILEAKAVEGSAVPIGSNIITPTQSVKHIEPDKSTQARAAKGTRKIQLLNEILTLTKTVK